MNILFTTFNQEGKGSFLRAFALAKELSKLGHHLTVLCASTENRFEDKIKDGVQLICFPWGHRFLHGYNPCEVRARKKWLGNKRFDLVHAFDMRPTCAQPALKAKKQGALFFTDWADWFGKGGSVEERANPLARAILRPLETYGEITLRKQAVGTTTICSHLYCMGKELGIPQHQLQILYNGFNQLVTPIATKGEARDALGIDPEQNMVGSLGAFFKKDFALLMEASQRCQLDKSIHFVHIGQGWSLAQNDNITFTGRVSDETLSLYLQACDILLLPMADIPANKGRFPLKFSEYLSAGRAVLTTKVGDVPDFIETYDCGAVCQANPNDFAQTILRMLSDPIALDAQSQNAYNLSQDPKHSWQERSSQLEKFYTKYL